MNCTISHLTVADVDKVDDLMKSNSATLGFLPKAALADYLKQGNVLGAIDSDNQVLGYLMYYPSQNHIRITHLCVSAQSRGQGIAKQLFDALKEERTNQTHIRLSCRRDFPAHNLWPKLGFVPIGEKAGRSAEGYPLTLWHYLFSQDAQQLNFFQAQISDEAVDVVIDAQIFFEFHEPDSDTAMPSKALLSDFLVDSLNLWIDDELLVEIDRQPDVELRQISRRRSESYPQIGFDKQRFEGFENLLKGILPSRSPSDESDIRHLAKTAASEVNIFVTRDTVLLKKSAEIYDLTGLDVLSPETLITRIHEISDRKSYTPVRVSGFDVEWRRLTSEDIQSFPYNSFLVFWRKKRKVAGEIKSLLRTAGTLSMRTSMVEV